MEASSMSTHIQVLLVAPLSADHMTKSGADQHEGGVAIWNVAYYTGAAVNLPVQPFNHIIGADTGPVFAGEIAAGHRLLNAILLHRR